MNKLFAIFALVFAFAFTAVAQNTPTTSQTKNEGVIAYSFLRQNVEFRTPTLAYNTDTDSHGVNAGYTRYFGGSATRAGVFGLTADLGVNVDNNEASLVTVAGGVTAKARNYKYVQPYARALVGVARQNVNRFNIADTSDISAAFIGGVGVDFNTSAYSRYKIGAGLDLVNTGFGGSRQNGLRGTVRFVF